MACTVTLCNHEINALKKKGLTGSLWLYLLTNTRLWSLKAASFSCISELKTLWWRHFPVPQFFAVTTEAELGRLVSAVYY